MLYLDLFCVSISVMCPKLSVRAKTALKGIILWVKLDVIERFNCGEWHKDILPPLNLGSGNAQIFSI